jgi:hypothetical protein
MCSFQHQYIVESGIKHQYIVESGVKHHNNSTPIFCLLSEPAPPTGQFLGKDSKDTDHILVHTDGNKLKACVYCQINKVKTRRGWSVKSYYMCKACEVPLCRGMRECFHHYHNIIGCKSFGNPTLHQN